MQTFFEQAMQQISSRASWMAILATAVIVAAIVTLVVRPARDSTQPIILDESVKLSACRAEALRLTKPEKIDIDLLSRISDFCYTQVRGEDLLGDFNIRRSNYFRQQFQGIVFLWMVVAITISGVVLAALQLAAAYKLASTGRGGLDQGGEVTLEEKRLSLKSSVTGLLILAVSFAFFMVFVAWVYPLTETKINPEGLGQTENPQPTLDIGGIGTPPQSSPSGPPGPSPSSGPAQSDKK